jgi:CRP-like cAMP-binding protein
MGKSQFFSQRKNLSLDDMMELTKIFAVEKVDALQDVITYGDKGDKFYIILRGSVSVLIPNPKISSIQFKLR